MALGWTKAAGDSWIATASPFSLKVQPKGDGRWIWEVYKGDAPNPTASGVRASLGAAKTTSEQFVMRSGLV